MRTPKPFATLSSTLAALASMVLSGLVTAAACAYDFDRAGPPDAPAASDAAAAPDAPAGGPDAARACSTAGGSPFVLYDCNGACVDLANDSKHCGDCTTTCAPTDECANRKCRTRCALSLTKPIVDPAGFSWDAVERAAATWKDAKAACESFAGGRLPTASELYRVNTAQTRVIADASSTNPLWSLVPVDTDACAGVRLSDGAASRVPVSHPLSFRCVCPPPQPVTHSGMNCYGPATGPCLDLGDGKRSVNLDVSDRIPLNHSGAAWECSFYRGRIATPRDLVEGIQRGLPGGSGQWLATSDAVMGSVGGSIRFALFKWTGTSVSLADALGIDASEPIHRFRCVGAADPTAPPAVPTAGDWMSPTGRRSEKSDHASNPFIRTLDGCWDLGGHLPTTGEYMELIEQGLPDGSDGQLYASDEVEPGIVASVKWVGTNSSEVHVETSLPGLFRDDTAAPYRCLYYPVDATYQGPGDAACAGGCTAVGLPGATGAKLWFDATDRAALAPAAAMAACQTSGGHLPSERDLIEGIRHGLTNGSSVAMWTSDVTSRGSVLLLQSVGWGGVDAAFTGAASTPAALTEQHAFRCFWTNEIR